MGFLVQSLRTIKPRVWRLPGTQSPSDGSPTLERGGNVIGAFAPVAGPTQKLDVGNRVAAALTPRDHMVKMEFFAGPALTAPGAIALGYGDLHGLGKVAC